MPRILIHISTNIRRALTENFKSTLRGFNEKYGMNMTMEIPGEDHHEESWICKKRTQLDFPDMALSHATDLAILSREERQEVFMPLPGRFPMRQEFKEKGLLDGDGILHTAFLVPFVIVCNTKMVPPEERPARWADLMDPKWYNKVTFPDAKTPITQAVWAFLQNRYPQRFKDFYSSVKFQNSPVEVVKSVGDGLFPLGIANISFAKMVEQKGVAQIWPAEGAVCTPQVVVYNRQADSRLLELGDFLFGRAIQEMITRQGFIPASPDIPLPPEMSDRMLHFPWDGWEQYFDMLRQAE